MKAKLVSLLLITLYFTQVEAQTEIDVRKNNLSLSAGYNSGSLLNLEFSPVARYDFSGLIYKLNYERYSSKRNLFEVELDFLNSELQSENIPEFNSDYTIMGLGFSYLKELRNKNNLAIHAGLQSQSRVSLYSNTNYILLEQGFGIGSKFSYKLNEKQSLSTKLAIPLLLLRASNSAADIYSLGRFQSLRWDFEYRYLLSKHFDLRATYDFNYSRLQVSSAFREVQYQFNLGLNYKF